MPIVLQSDTLMEHLTGIVHAGTQQHTHRVDLTAAAVLKPVGAGELDFGGGEFKPAHTERMEPQKRDASDDYGWWELSEGGYRVRFNEQVEGPRELFMLLTPHRHLSQAGVVADSLLIAPEEDPEALALNFQVPAAGLNIKENARMASLYMLSGQ
ncbi:MAG: hypothetical protein U5K31_03115 [Balneolaceae bacterium]|nr:hypothetical protein [Balneolaceae bacterium]